MAVSVLLVLAAPASAATNLHSADARAQAHSAIIFPPPPDCGDSISLQSVTYTFDKYSFKIVGVDLGQWLGKGNGIMAWQAGVVNQAEPFETGSVNASPTAGARTGTISLYPVTVDQTLDIEVEIRYTEEGTDLCNITFNPIARA
jgi:hypothetical protein